MDNPPYTDADVELVASTFVAEAKKNPVESGTPHWIGVQTRTLLGPTEYDIARAVLDALVERGHGLAPVIAHQWSVRYRDGFVDGAKFTEAGARQRAAELGGEVVYRAVGPWMAAESGPLADRERSEAMRRAAGLPETDNRCPGRVVAYADGRTGRCMKGPAGHPGECA